MHRAIRFVLPSTGLLLLAASVSATTVEPRETTVRSAPTTTATRAVPSAIRVRVAVRPTAVSPASLHKVTVCHIPPGNPSNFHEISVSADSLDDHLAHGDIAGSCEGLCSDNDDCGFDADAFPDTDFCYRGDGPIGIGGGAPSPDCDDKSIGACAAVPLFCPAIVDPVCDCDGNLYDNACLANQQGQNWHEPAELVDLDGDGFIDAAVCS